MLKKFLIGTFALALVLVIAQSASAFSGATLRVGSRGADVMELQALVGATPIDGIFGNITKAKVMAWQANNALTPDGIFGPMSRTKAMGAYNSGNPNAAGELCPNGMTLASNCTLAPNAQAVALCPNGMTVASNCGASSSTPGTSGQEGSVAVSYDAVPADNLAVNKGEEKAVMGIKVKATGSDMTVNRLWLDINTRIWLSASNASLWDGSTLVADLPLSASTVTEVTAGSAYQLQFNGLNIVVPEGTTKVLTLKVRRPELTSASASSTVATTSTLRATDGAGITNTYTLTGRTINLSSTTAATTGTLTATLSSTSPAIQSVSGLSTTAGNLTAVKLMDVDLKATDGAINITAISGTDSSTGTPEEDMASLELRDSDGVSVLSSVAVTSADTFAFSSLNIDVPAGTTKKVSIWAQANHVASSYVVAGDGIAAVVTAITATTGTSFTNASITPTVTSNTQYLFQYAPAFALGATSATSADGSAVGKTKGNYSIAFTVTAPAGSPIYVDTTTTLAAVAKTAAYGGTLSTSSSISGDSSTGGTSGYDYIGAGLSRTWTISGTVPDGGSAGFTGMKIVSVKWNTADSTSGTTTQNWGLADFKTAAVYVTAS